MARKNKIFLFVFLFVALLVLSPVLIVQAQPSTGPNLLSPGDNTYTNDNTPYFEWENIGTENITHYRLVIDNDINFADGENSYDNLNLTDNWDNFKTHTENVLSEGTWYWKVQAENAGGWGPFSGTRTLMVDVTPPYVVSVAPSDSLITDGTGAFSIEAFFSENMNFVAVLPTFTFTPDISDTLTAGAYASYDIGDVFYWVYDINDANKEYADVDVTVSGARDVAGNLMISSIWENIFDIDMKNPQVVSINVNDSLITDSDVGGIFTVTVTYDDNMNETIPPDIAFIPPVATTLNFTGENWTDNLTYNANYTITDDNIELTGIDILVENARDDNNNIQYPFQDNDKFNIETQNPTVSSVIVSHPVISSDNAGQTFTVTVQYSETMDNTVNPTISFTPDVTADTLTAGPTAWSPDNIYFYENFTIADADVENADVDVGVSGGKDLVGNTQTAYTATDLFDIDTKKPTVVSATASPDPANAGIVTITVVFHENMDNGVSPTVQVTGIISSPHTVTETSYVGDTWVGTFTLIDHNEIATATISVSGAKDLVGHVMDPAPSAGTFGVDTVAPTPRGPIFIESDDFFNYDNGVGGGSGTALDPYLIENFIIDASGAHGIRIENTTKYFVIRNCLVENGSSYRGIYLENAINGKIDNNTCKNDSYGIYVYSSYVNLTNNTFGYNTLSGIHLDYSDNCTIDNNTCSNNSDDGIIINNSENCTVSNNTCSNNPNFGIYLIYSDNCTIENNTCSNNSTDGIYLNESDGCTIENNTCSNNSDCGIYLYDSYGNDLTNNTCSNNNYGIYIESSGPLDGVTLDSNTCESNYYNGIYIWCDLLLSNATINNNTTYNNNYNNEWIGDAPSTNSYSGITIFSNSCEDVTFDNNTCEYEGWNGIHLVAWTYMDDITFTNNVCLNSYTTGIMVRGFDDMTNVTVSNNTCSYNEYIGIMIGAWHDYPAMENITVENNTCEGNYSDGIVISCDSLTNATINNTCSDSNLGSGIYICANSGPCEDVTLENNTCEYNSNYGIYLDSSGYNDLTNNTCSNNNYGIYLDSSGYNDLTNNTCSNNNYGIYLDYSHCNILDNNTCEGNNYGIYIYWESEYDNLTNNNCSNNSDDGIYLDESDYNDLTNNTCSNNSDDGIYLDYSDYCTIDNNTCENNEDGIYVDDDCDYLNLINNNCSNNEDDGIYLYDAYECDIENNTCENNYDGIYLDDSWECTIENNNCSNNSDDGIYLDYSDYCTIDNNTCENNEDGIYVDDESEYFDLINNTCSNNEDDGIYIYWSWDFVVDNNTCENNEDGIYVDDCDYFDLTNNTCENNYDDGIYIYYCEDFIVDNNTCENNYDGIYLDDCDYFDLINNTCSNNSYGIYLYDSYDCIIFHNYLLNNTENNAYDDESNDWDESGVGNYWSDWQPPEHPDNDGDGIVDEARLILGGAEDYYPLVLPDFSISVSPASGSVQAGGSTTATVSLTPVPTVENFEASLTASGQPSGVSVSFSPSSGVPLFSSTMTINVGSSVSAGTYTITVKGTCVADRERTSIFTLMVSAILPSGYSTGAGTITPAAPATVQIQNSPITGLQINVNSTVQNVNVTVTQSTSEPAGISIGAPGATYSYLDITVQNLSDADIDYVVISFKVEKSWLNANGIDPTTVALYRYSGGVWTALPTERVSEDATYVYYSASSPGLSVFSISGHTKVVPAPAPTPTPPPPSPGPSPAPSPTFGPAPPGIEWLVILGGGVAIVIALLGVMWPRKPKVLK